MLATLIGILVLQRDCEKFYYVTLIVYLSIKIEFTSGCRSRSNLSYIIENGNICRNIWNICKVNKTSKSQKTVIGISIFRSANFVLNN